ncbi:hypothetical protein P4S67_12360 [Pseudoalteromonas sp. B137]
MQDDLLPIHDWSLNGRNEYIESNRAIIELIIDQGLEEFDEQTAYSAFQSQDRAKNKIINLFCAEQFEVSNLPIEMPKNIRLFSQIAFWVKYKTAGKVYTGNRVKVELEENYQSSQSVDNDLKISELASNLEQLNHCVAPDIIGYWLLANKKLLRELASSKSLKNYADLDEIKNEVSDTQKTRYKADASFRYLTLFLNLDSRFGNFDFYQKKYLVKGLNRPQYVANKTESHHEKHKVRLVIKNIIHQFHEILSSIDDRDILERSLFKSIAKSAVLDVYEINKSDPDRLICMKKLKRLRAKPSSLKELQDET